MIIYMKKFLLILGISVVFAVILYFFMAQKAFRAEQARMYGRYQKNEISKPEFEQFISSYTFMDVLKNPKSVRSVD